MTPTDTLAQLPDETRVGLIIGGGDLTVRDLRKAFAEPPKFRVLTTTEAAETFGYSGDTWREWAKAGEVRDAYQDGEGGIWRLPFKGCEEKLARVVSQSNRGKRRGPWAASAQAERAGTEGDQEGKVLRLRPAPVGGR